MNWFVLAQAAQQAAPAAAPKQPGIGSFLVPLVLMLVAMYFLVIKPQKRKQREHDEQIKRTKVGDRVVTVGGLHGTITAVNDKTFMVKVADKVTLEISRSHVAQNLRPGDDDATDKKDNE